MFRESGEAGERRNRVTSEPAAVSVSGHDAKCWDGGLPGAVEPVSDDVEESRQDLLQ